MNKIQWKPEYSGLEFRVIALAEFSGLLSGQTIERVIHEVQILSDEDKSELFMLLFSKEARHE